MPSSDPRDGFEPKAPAASVQARFTPVSLPMHTVFTCAHPVDAHLIANLLTQHGIEAQVFGEYLIGAAGELPPGNLVRVVILDAARIDEAKQIIADWESATPCATNDIGTDAAQ